MTYGNLKICSGRGTPVSFANETDKEIQLILKRYIEVSFMHSDLLYRGVL
jgi:hypothetical protein